MSCNRKKVDSAESNPAEIMTQESESLTVVYSKQGQTSFRFFTPLMESYDLAPEPYMEFRRGVDIVTFNDTTHLKESTLTANYAIRYENLQLWEARGNVIAENAAGQRLETEQLFWDEKAKRIYSNVDSKVTQQGGYVVYGEGFESDDKFEEWEFRKTKGRVPVNIEPKDSTDAGSGTPPPPLPAARPEREEDPDHPVIREGEPVAKPQSRQERRALRKAEPTEVSSDGEAK